MELLRRHIWLLGLLLAGLALEGGGARAGEDRPAALFEEGVEQFVLEWPRGLAHPAKGWDANETLTEAAHARQIGFVEMRRREFDGAPQLELEVAYPFENIRLFTVECLNPRSPRLVWREVSRGAGRTVFAEWTAESEELRVLEWGIDGKLRERSATREGAVMPHYLLELVRAGNTTSGSFEVFDPLSHELETWTLTTAYERDSRASVDYLRKVEFHRSDGTLAGRYVFRGTELLRFQWQEGGATARRVGGEELAEFRARWGFSDGSNEPRADTDAALPSQVLDAAAPTADNAASRVKDA